MSFDLNRINLAGADLYLWYKFQVSYVFHFWNGVNDVAVSTDLYREP